MDKLVPIPPSDTWMQEQIEKARARMQAETEYMFGLTHYDWMYRATGDEKYLEEQQKYIRDNKKMKILEDGSVEGQTFSGDKYKGEYPSPKYGKETYEEYRKRVNICVEQGFHLGDLGWGDWDTYCKGSGRYEGVGSNEIIGE